MADHLTLLVTGAPLAARADDVAGSLVDDGWTVEVAVTEAAQPWIDPHGVTRATGSYPRSAHRSPTGARGNEPDVVVVCPATFNTVGKAAVGIADSYVHSVLCEAIGNRTPILMVPMVKHSLWRHPAWTDHLDVLAAAGVLFLDPLTGEQEAAPVESGTGALVTERFDPQWIVTAVRKCLNHS